MNSGKRPLARLSAGGVSARLVAVYFVACLLVMSPAKSLPTASWQGVLRDIAGSPVGNATVKLHPTPGNLGRGADNSSFFFIPINVPGGTSPNQGRFGALARDTFRGPGFHNFDMAMIKDTPFGKRGNRELGTLEFRAEFFNIFNIMNFGLPSNTVLGGGSGIISHTAGSSRQIQFSLKLIY